LDVHERIQPLCRSGDFDTATTVILRELGPSVYHYLISRTRDEDVAAEAFSRFAEDLWRGMKKFRHEVNVRIWVFAIARNSAGQVLRKRNRERARSRDFTSTLANRIANEVRTTTIQYLRTDTKLRFAQLRERLSPDEQAMLVLRINQRLSWDDIARIHLSDGTGEVSSAELKREAARLRKQFQLVRQKLRQLAQAEGLIPDAEEH
jgi:RNA polymerase sigma-70 factor (ECF subfamily)